jgi:hypothetical protein
MNKRQRIPTVVGNPLHFRVDLDPWIRTDERILHADTLSSVLKILFFDKILC